MDVSGRVIAFGGRKLENNEKMAKYINSNENLVYSKKKHLFALNLAKQSDSKRIILVEGYMDAISQYQIGFNNVVASQGTAITEEQGRLLRKYSEQDILSYDSDGAGQEAIMRGLSILENQGCDARVLQMEGAKDPDEFVIKYGSGRFKMLVDEAISLIEFKIKMIKNKYNLENANDKIRFLKEITKILSNVDNKIEKEIYIENVASNYNISKEAIYAEVNKASYSKANEKVLVKPAIKEEKVIEISPAVIKRENMILYLLINHFRESYEAIVTNITPDDFKFETNKFIFEKILESPAEESEKILQAIANIEDTEVQSHVSEILVTDYEISSIEKCIEDVVNIYNKDRLANRKLEIIKLLDGASLTKEEVAKLENELSEIIVELAKRKQEVVLLK